MTERIPDPNTIAADWWAQLLAEARALATMAMADQGITGITDHLLRCKGVLR